MLIAKLVSTRSTCNSRPTGAVLVKDKQILATGYNGSMPGAPHCSDQVMPDGSPYCHRRALQIADVDKYNWCRASHAEANAIAQAARHGVPIKGATLYVTLEPCTMCAAAMSFARVRRLYFGAADPKGGAVEHGVRFFSAATCHHRPEVYGGIDEKRAGALLKRFFRERR